MSNPTTEHDVQALRGAGWRPLRELLAALPRESSISEHTFLKSWRPADLVPRSIEPKVFHGYGPGRGRTVSLWPPETGTFVQVARELQRYVSLRGRRPRKQRSASAQRARSIEAHAALRVSLWSIGCDYDLELIRTTLLEELRRFGALIRNRSEQMFRPHKSPSTDVPSKPEEAALEDLVDAHQTRIVRAGLEPESVVRELGLLLTGQAGSESLLDRISKAVSEAAPYDLERTRGEARTLLLFYLSYESWRRQMVQVILSAEPDFAAEGLERLGEHVQAEWGMLDDAWRHLSYFPVIAAHLMYSQHSSDPELIEWRRAALPLYPRWTFWEALPPAIKDAVQRLQIEK